MERGAPSPGRTHDPEGARLFQAARRQEQRRKRRRFRVLEFSAKRIRGALVVLVGVALLVSGLVVIGRPTRSVSPGSGGHSEKWCTRRVVTSPGGSRISEAAQTPAPVWSGSVGTIEGVVAGAALSTIGNCLASVDVSTGRVHWVRALPSTKRTGVALAADNQVIVAARDARSCAEPTSGPKCVEDLVGLTGLDPATGRRMWSLPLRAFPAPQLPAGVSGSTVVVVRGNGTVDGVTASTGRLEWSEPAPPRSAHRAEPLGSILASGSVDVVVYRCGGQQIVRGIDPASGRVIWHWQADRPGASAQASDVMSRMAPTPEGDGVVVIGDASMGTIAAPVYRWEVTGRPFGGSAGVVVLSLRTGRPLWALSVPQPTTLEVAVGKGEVCIARRTGIGCRDTINGMPAWHWTTPTALPHPVNSLPSVPPIVTSLGVVSWAVASASVSSARAAPQGTSASDTFAVWSFKMSDGAFVSTQVLAPFDGQGHPWPPETPKVLAAAHGIVLVSPAHYGTTVLEALRT